MSPKSSPKRDITELFNRHRITNIPSDQRALLERPDSWAVELKNTPHGLSQVPGHVLESVKATYVANKEIFQERTPVSKKRSASPITSPSNKRRRNGNASTLGSDHAKPPQSSPVSSPERAVSHWSESPERDPSKDSDRIAAAAAVGHNTQSSIVHETPKTGFAGPPRPISRPVIEIPPSSAETEDDLETRIPDAQPLHNGSINRTAVPFKPTAPSPLSTNRTMATPPCAQPSNTAQTVVPNTVFTNKEIFQASESPKNGQPPHRIKFKAINVDDVGRKRRKSHNEKDRLPPTIMPPIIASSIPTSSDSVVPYSGNIAATQEYIRESIEEKEEDVTMDHVEEIVPSTNLKGSAHHQPKIVIKREPHDTDEKKSNNEAKSTQQTTTSSQIGSSKANRSTNSQTQVNDQMATREPPAPAPLIAPGAPLEPYEAFVQQYPDYPGDNGGDKLPGTKSNFIYACVYLNYLRPRKELRDCLYDDFIRVFPCSYREYVVRSRMKPLVAIKWFNKQKGPLIYDKYLVNRGNLSHILRSYPEEFAHANELVSKKDGDNASEDDLIIYTSSEGEEDFEEDDHRRSVSRSSHHSSARRRSVESPEPIASIERDMDIDLPEILPAHPSNSSRQRSPMASRNDLELIPECMPATKPTQPARSYTRPQNTASEKRPLQSSRAQEILTQPPPPTSSEMPQTSMLPPSTIGSTIKPKAPRPSQYFKKISTTNLLKSTPKKRTAKELEELREHFRRSKGTGSQDRRSSSSRFG
ncbi:hypothetical protein IL306_014826 [Fusarium sp. DS 682]|nr:hypothetical protein IL306_014826 [Fusarium sp. DS 682]